MNIQELFRNKGYAAGHYYNKCSVCGEHFVGDKRAWTCFYCASEYISSHAVLGAVLALETRDFHTEEDWIRKAHVLNILGKYFA